MEARQVYEMQGRLEAAERRLSELAQQEIEAQRAGAWISSGDYLRSPEGRAVEKLRQEVRAAQAEIGGVVYRIPAENLGVVEKLEKLQKRAAKLSAGKVNLRVTDEREEHASKIDPLVAAAELGYVPRYKTVYRFLVLDAEPVKLAGWAFLATLTIESGGVMISKVPAFAYAWSLHREGAASETPTDYRKDDPALQAAQTRLDAMNLGAYADEKTATHCDHCGLSRRRTKTHLVQHVETGEIKQVGSNCLRDFLGIDPATIMRYATYLQEIEGALDEDGFSGGGGGGRREWLTEEYLTHVCTIIRTSGWRSRSDSHAGRPTADAAWDNIRDYGKAPQHGQPRYEEITEADHERAVAAIEWAKEHLGAKVHQTRNANDFERNMYVAANGDTVPKKGDGVLAYLPVAHARFQEREIERAARDKAEGERLDEFYGEIKQRGELTLKVFNVFESQGNYGTTWVTILRDEEGRAFKWFGSYELERGVTYTGTWTVKAHEAHAKYGKQTIITRPAKLGTAESVNRREAETARA